MEVIGREVIKGEMFRRLYEVREMCARQRATLTIEREQVRLCREMRHARARLQLRKQFLKQVEAVTKPLIESAHIN
jgi:hypothetical protein